MRFGALRHGGVFLSAPQRHGPSESIDVFRHVLVFGQSEASAFAWFRRRVQFQVDLFAVQMMIVGVLILVGGGGGRRRCRCV